mmetsp:Transcript_61080/g.189212  ORF Transcript_61080/g.189212 Transcript_61080/m.189212 type:complete len:701 (-) Transcript_61080:223-2325(-)
MALRGTGGLILGAPSTPRPLPVRQPQQAKVSTRSLTEYFQSHYRSGGLFETGPGRQYSGGLHWTFVHDHTGIHVWRDAVDLTGGSSQDFRVLFHYTDDHAFQNITDEDNEAAEVFASLRTGGADANAYYGQGIYTVPHPPDQWWDRHQILDNNYRNMMRRDLEQNGQRYVDDTYPPKAAFCVPLLVCPKDAYDVSKVQTPEMKAANVPPGKNLKGDPLDERCCVVVRLEGAEGAVEGARARLVETLRVRARAAAAQHGPEGDVTIQAKGRLGCTLGERGCFAEAEPILREVLALRERTSKAGDPDRDVAVQNSIQALARLFRQSGKLTEAEKLLRRSFEAIERTEGPDHKHTIIAVSALAEVLAKLGKLAEAETLQRRIARSRHCPGRTVALTYYNLSGLLAEQGKREQAEQYLRKALEIREREVGKGHAEVFVIMAGLNVLLSQQGKLAEAERLMRSLLDAQTQKLGNDHPDTISTVDNLAVVLYKQGRLDEAGPLIRRVISARERKLGKDHPDTLNSLNTLAGLLHAQGALQEAEQLLRRVKEGQERTLGHEHPGTLTTLNNLAVLLVMRGETAEGLPLLRRVIGAQARDLGKDHPDVLCSLNNLAGILLGLGELAEAEAIFRYAVPAMERKLGSSHPDTVSAFGIVALLAEKRGAYAEAEQLLVRELRGLERIHGPEHKETEAVRQKIEQLRREHRR